MRILLVDDDQTLIDVLRISLEKKNYVLDAVTDGEQGWIYGSTYTYDLIILDWSLPKLDGISLCQRFRANGYHMPILLLTARNGSQDKIRGLDAGADDYLGKPFEVEELAARIRALWRRLDSNSLPVLSWGDLQLDPRTCQVTYRKTNLFLTAKEYGLLELFLRHRKEVFSVEEIIESLWSAVEYPTEATVRSHLRRLRQKLKLAGLSEDPIETLRGRGYCLKHLPQDHQIDTKNSTIQLESPDNKQELHLAALSTVWKKYQHKIDHKLETLKLAVQEIEDKSLSSKDRQSTKLIAHSLAGNIGIFGFHRGSSLAKEIEQLLQTDISQNKEKVSQLKTLFNELCQELNVDENYSEKLGLQLKEHSPLVLIIDSETKFTEQLTQKATSQGIQTAIAATPELAQIWLKNNQERQLPNAVILKISFSKLVSNLQSLRDYLSLIEEFNLRTPSIPVLVIGDRSRFQDRLQVARHGGCVYLEQPVSPSQAIAFCQQVLERSSQGKKVMIVDDDVELLQVLPSLLQPWGFKLTTLDDPRQFWDVLQAVDPNLLVLDIEMPYLSGIELCKVLRTHPDWCKLPVLFLSVHTDVAIREQVFAIGADDFVNKPVVGQQLADRILNRLERCSLSIK